MWGRLEVGYREVRLAISLEEANLWRSGIHRRWISLSKVYIYQTIILHLFKYFVCAKKNIVRTFLTPTQRGLTSFFQVSIYHDSVFTVKHLCIRPLPSPGPLSWNDIKSVTHAPCSASASLFDRVFLLPLLFLHSPWSLRVLHDDNNGYDGLKDLHIYS